MILKPSVVSFIVLYMYLYAMVIVKKTIIFILKREMAENCIKTCLQYGFKIFRLHSKLVFVSHIIHKVTMKESNKLVFLEMELDAFQLIFMNL